MTAITVLAIAVLLCLNMVFAYIGSERMLFIDTTSEGFYTLSDAMKSTCRELLDGTNDKGEKKQIKITFCKDPDYLIADDDLRVTYYMAIALRNMFDNVTVETVNLRYNPTAVSKYETTSRQEITDDDIIVSYGSKYRVANAAYFWRGDHDTYDGEYRIASIIASLTAVERPVAYFVTDHGETYYDPEQPESEGSLATAELADLLTEMGLAIDTLALGEEDIPEDCVLLIINNPTEDFVDEDMGDHLDEFGYVSQTEKLDRYMISDAGAILLNKAYYVNLPVLEDFAYEWGISFGNALVKDEDSSLSDIGEKNTALIGVYENLETDFGYAYYGQYSALSSAPRMVFTNSGFLSCSFTDGIGLGEPGTYNVMHRYTTFIGTSDSAVAYEPYDHEGNLNQGNTVIAEGGAMGYKCLAAAVVRTSLDEYSAETTSSYLFCTNTADFYSNDILGNGSYANRDIMESFILDLTRTDRFVSSDLGGDNPNVNYGGKWSAVTELEGFTAAHAVWYVIIIAVLPVSALVLGIVIFVKRKFL